jgi:ATP-dependent DNA ligase
MLAKVLEDNKPFEKNGNMLGQWKIDGLRCIIGATDKAGDIFDPITLTYHSRTGEDWTHKMYWMDKILLPKISKELLDMMIEEGACLDGELYLPGYSVNDINSFVKNTQLKQHYQLQYWCYDICCENMSAVRRAEFLRMNTKNIIFNIQDKETHLNNKEQFGLLYTYTVPDFIYAEDIRNKFIDLGFEGLIVRNPSAEYQFGKRNQAMFKFKKVDDGLFTIIAINSEHKRSDLPLFVLQNDINDELFECSINKSQNVQREILANKENYIGKKMLVEFRARSGVNQVPFHARGIEIK